MSRSRNIPLAVGAAMVLLIGFVAVFGPALAPRNPTDYNYVLQVNGAFIRPPFPALVSPDFPLGSDGLGRDTLSQLLWAVRPTLALVLIVVAVRLVLGTLLGLYSGWASDRGARLVDGLISLALAAPVFIVALLSIAAFQPAIGALAFVIGLALTGWAEPARIAREQARIVKGQQFIEASRALGLSDVEIMCRHVVRQLTPTLTLTGAFEVAGVLLALASLAFLGHYVGGSNWAMSGDFTAQRISGLPELGQMLATAAERRNELTGMLIAGGAVACVIVAFMLLGEGLRIRMAQESRRRSALQSTITGFIEVQRVEQRLYDALAQRRTRRRLAFGAIALLLASAGVVVWAATRRPPESPVVAVPGGHIWAGDRRDPEGTLRGAFALDNARSPTATWTLETKDAFAGGPAIADDGTLYIATKGGELLAVEPISGGVRWQTKLDAPAVGAPALLPDGGIVVAGETGGLTRVAPDGQTQWSLLLDQPAPALSGPIMDEQGNIYLALDGALVSATPGGEWRWRTGTAYSYFSPFAHLKRDSGHLFFKDIAINAADGGVILPESRDPLDQFIVGEDGRVYLQSERNLLEWRATDDGAALAEVAKWDYTKQFPAAVPQDASVSADGRTWLLLGNPFQDARLAWFAPGGELIGSRNFPLRQTRVVAVGRDGTIYLCGQRNRDVQCFAFAFGAQEPLWQVTLPNGHTPVGGALADGMLYVATEAGQLVALGSE